MPIELRCECGKLLRVADENAGRRLKCPSCEKELVVPDAASGDKSPFLTDTDDDAEGALADPANGHRVTGRTASVMLGSMCAWMFGTASLTLRDGRVVQRSDGLLTKSMIEIPISQVDSVEITRTPNPLLLLFGLLTIGINGLGLIPLVLYLILRSRFLLVHSRASVAIVAMKGDGQPYQDFKEAVLQEAESVRGLGERQA